LGVLGGKAGGWTRYPQYVYNCFSMERDILNSLENINKKYGAVLKRLGEVTDTAKGEVKKEEFIILLEEADNDIENGNFLTEEEMDKKLDLL
jgi:hypothetical protein